MRACAFNRSEIVDQLLVPMKNFADDVVERASVFVPRTGSMTVTMAMRDAVRLYRNARMT